MQPVYGDVNHKLSGLLSSTQPRVLLGRGTVLGVHFGDFLRHAHALFARAQQRQLDHEERAAAFDHDININCSGYAQWEAFIGDLLDKITRSGVTVHFVVGSDGLAPRNVGALFSQVPADIDLTINQELWNDAAFYVVLRFAQAGAGSEAAQHTTTASDTQADSRGAVHVTHCETEADRCLSDMCARGQVHAIVSAAVQHATFQGCEWAPLGSMLSALGATSYPPHSVGSKGVPDHEQSDTSKTAPQLSLALPTIDRADLMKYCGVHTCPQLFPLVCALAEDRTATPPAGACWRELWDSISMDPADNDWLSRCCCLSSWLTTQVLDDTSHDEALTFVCSKLQGEGQAPKAVKSFREECERIVGCYMPPSPHEQAGAAAAGPPQQTLPPPTPDSAALHESSPGADTSIAAARDDTNLPPGIRAFLRCGVVHLTPHEAALLCAPSPEAEMELRGSGSARKVRSRLEKLHTHGDDVKVGHTHAIVQRHIAPSLDMILVRPLQAGLAGALGLGQVCWDMHLTQAQNGLIHRAVCEQITTVADGVQEQRTKKGKPKPKPKQLESSPGVEAFEALCVGRAMTTIPPVAGAAAGPGAAPVTHHVELGSTGAAQVQAWLTAVMFVTEDALGGPLQQLGAEWSYIPDWAALVAHQQVGDEVRRLCDPSLRPYARPSAGARDGADTLQSHMLHALGHSHLPAVQSSADALPLSTAVGALALRHMGSMQLLWRGQADGALLALGHLLVEDIRPPIVLTRGECDALCGMLCVLAAHKGHPSPALSSRAPSKRQAQVASAFQACIHAILQLAQAHGVQHPATASHADGAGISPLLCPVGQLFDGTLLNAMLQAVEDAPSADDSEGYATCHPAVARVVESLGGSVPLLNALRSTLTASLEHGWGTRARTAFPDSLPEAVWARPPRTAVGGAAAGGAAAAGQGDKAGENKLPIHDHQDQLLEHIDRNWVTIIQGETGCGKSTQVPQFLLKAARSQHSKVRILVTQPRRMAAVQLAERVASELGESVGQTVGYRIGQQRVESGATRLTFVTTGWLLTWLIHNFGSLGEYTHVVLDEVHERSCDTDLTCLIMKLYLLGECHAASEQWGVPKHKFQSWQRMLSSGELKTPVLMLQNLSDKFKADYRKRVRLVVMSATLEAERLANYFNVVPWEPKPVPYTVPTRRFKVDHVFLDDLMDAWKAGHYDLRAPTFSRAAALQRTVQDMCKDQKSVTLGAGTAGTQLEVPHTNPATEFSRFRLIAHLAICTVQPGKTVIVFLDGMVSIYKLVDQLHELLGANAKGSARPAVIALHSLLDHDAQMKAFDTKSSGPGCIVVATNIAESSVTLPNVSHIIDTGLHKQVVPDDKTGMERLSVQYISKASAAQRAGRAGRQAPGVALHLYSKALHQRMLPHDVPEVRRVSLARTVLRAKCLSAASELGNVMHALGLSSVSQLLMECLDPPNTAGIARAVSQLALMGAVESASEKAPVTAMGQAMVSFSGSMHLVLFLRLCAAAGFPLDAVLLSGAMSCPSPFRSQPPVEDCTRALQLLDEVSYGQDLFDHGSFSEVVAIRNAIVAWRQQPPRNRHKWCTKHGLVHKRMQIIHSECLQIFQRILRPGAMPEGALGADLGAVELQLSDWTTPFDASLLHANVDSLRGLLICALSDTLMASNAADLPVDGGAGRSRRSSSQADDAVMADAMVGQHAAGQVYKHAWARLEKLARHLSGEQVELRRVPVASLAQQPGGAAATIADPLMPPPEKRSQLADYAACLAEICNTVREDGSGIHALGGYMCVLPKVPHELCNPAVLAAALPSSIQQQLLLIVPLQDAPVESTSAHEQSGEAVAAASAAPSGASAGSYILVFNPWARPSINASGGARLEYKVGASRLHASPVLSSRGLQGMPGVLQSTASALQIRTLAARAGTQVGGPDVLDAGIAGHAVPMFTYSPPALRSLQAIRGSTLRLPSLQQVLQPSQAGSRSDDWRGTAEVATQEVQAGAPVIPHVPTWSLLTSQYIRIAASHILTCEQGYSSDSSDDDSSDSDTASIQSGTDDGPHLQVEAAGVIGFAFVHSGTGTGHGAGAAAALAQPMPAAAPVFSSLQQDAFGSPEFVQAVQGFVEDAAPPQSFASDAKAQPAFGSAFHRRPFAPNHCSRVEDSTQQVADDSRLVLPDCVHISTGSDGTAVRVPLERPARIWAVGATCTVVHDKANVSGMTMLWKHRAAVATNVLLGLRGSCVGLWLRVPVGVQHIALRAGMCEVDALQLAGAFDQTQPDIKDLGWPITMLTAINAVRRLMSVAVAATPSRPVPELTASIDQLLQHAIAFTDARQDNPEVAQLKAWEGQNVLRAQADLLDARWATLPDGTARGANRRNPTQHMQWVSHAAQDAFPSFAVLSAGLEQQLIPGQWWAAHAARLQAPIPDPQLLEAALFDVRQALRTLEAASADVAGVRT